MKLNGYKWQHRLSNQVLYIIVQCLGWVEIHPRKSRNSLHKSIVSRFQFIGKAPRVENSKSSSLEQLLVLLCGAECWTDSLNSNQETGLYYDTTWQHWTSPGKLVISVLPRQVLETPSLCCLVVLLLSQMVCQPLRKSAWYRRATFIRPTSWSARWPAKRICGYLVSPHNKSSDLQKYFKSVTDLTWKALRFGSHCRRNEPC